MVAANLDDRMGLFCMYRIAKELKGLKMRTRAPITFVSTVGEETWSRAAQVTGFQIEPDIAITIDATAASDQIRDTNEDSIIKKPELYREFKTWYTENFDKNIPKGTDLYNYMTKKLGDYNGCWTGYNIKYDYNNDILEDTDI